MGKKSGSWQFPAHYRKARNCQESLFGIFWKLLAKFWKWHKFLAIPSSLYIGKKLPGTTCILKVQPLPGNFYPIYRELGIDRMWLHFMELTGTTFMVKVDPVDSQPIKSLTQELSKTYPQNFCMSPNLFKLAWMKDPYGYMNLPEYGFPQGPYSPARAISKIGVYFGSKFSNCHIGLRFNLRSISFNV